MYSLCSNFHFNNKKIFYMMITTFDSVLLQKRLAIFGFWVDSKRNMIAILDCLSMLPCTMLAYLHPQIILSNETLKNRIVCWLGWVTSLQSKLLVRTWNLYWMSEGVCCCFLVMLVYSDAGFASKWVAYCSHLFHSNLLWGSSVQSIP